MSPVESVRAGSVSKGRPEPGHTTNPGSVSLSDDSTSSVVVAGPGDSIYSISVDASGNSGESVCVSGPDDSINDVFVHTVVYRLWTTR